MANFVAMKRTAKKLALPVIALVMMTTMMAVEAARRPAPASPTIRSPGPAARVAHDLRQR
jgi:hypothetical protein